MYYIGMYYISTLPCCYGLNCVPTPQKCVGALTPRTTEHDLIWK